MEETLRKVQQKITAMLRLRAPAKRSFVGKRKSNGEIKLIEFIRLIDFEICYDVVRMKRRGKSSPQIW